MTDFPSLLQSIQTNFANAEASGPIFHSEASGDALWQLFLGNLSRSERQGHTCSCCRDFFSQAGNLVRVNQITGLTESVLFQGPAPTGYCGPWARLYSALYATPISRLWTSQAYQRVGESRAGGWNHIFIRPTKTVPAFPELNSQAIFYLGKWLSRLNLETLAQTEYIFRTHNLPRAEKYISILLPLRSLKTRSQGYNAAPISQQLWALCAIHRPELVHLPRSILGTFMETLELQGQEAAIQAWRSMTNQQTYQRPSAEPKAGNIDQAEKALAGLSESLRRRPALLTETTTLWLPGRQQPSFPRSGARPTLSQVSAAEPTSRVFDKLRQPQPQRGPAMFSTMTWVKFVRDILPQAQKIATVIPQSGPFTVMVTGVNQQSPGLFKWPGLLSWYTYPNLRPATQWGLLAGTLTQVLGIVPLPSDIAGPGVIIVLEGAKDSINTSSSLFPEILKPELFPVRRTIEAYSCSTPLEPAPAGQLAQGLGLKADRTSVSLIVELPTIKVEVIIDRWE